MTKEILYPLIEIEPHAAELIKLVRLREALESENRRAILITKPQAEKPTYTDLRIYFVDTGFSTDSAGFDPITYQEAIRYIHSAGITIGDLPHYQPRDTQISFRDRLLDTMNAAITDTEYRAIEKIAQRSLIEVQTARMEQPRQTLQPEELNSWLMYSPRQRRGFLSKIVLPTFPNPLKAIGAAFAGLRSYRQYIDSISLYSRSRIICIKD